MSMTSFKYPMADNNSDEMNDVNDTPYDPMALNFENQPVIEPLEPNKRFKTTEKDDDILVSPRSLAVNPDAGLPILDDSNSIKLKKGNLVIRKATGADTNHEVSDLCQNNGYTVVNPARVPLKSVKYLPDGNIERVKFFIKNAEPSAPALTIEQVKEVQKNLEIKAKNAALAPKHEYKSNPELDKRDGINKDKKRVLEDMKKVSLFLYFFTTYHVYVSLKSVHESIKCLYRKLSLKSQS